jgi:hypothetical protein
MKFPKGRAVLSNAKLEFVHLDNILADNKKAFVLFDILQYIQ